MRCTCVSTIKLKLSNTGIAKFRINACLIYHFYSDVHFLDLSTGCDLVILVNMTVLARQPLLLDLFGSVAVVLVSSWILGRIDLFDRTTDEAATPCANENSFCHCVHRY